MRLLLNQAKQAHIKWLLMIICKLICEFQLSTHNLCKLPLLPQEKQTVPLICTLTACLYLLYTMYETKWWNPMVRITIRGQTFAHYTKVQPLHLLLSVRPFSHGRPHVLPLTTPPGFMERCLRGITASSFISSEWGGEDAKSTYGWIFTMTWCYHLGVKTLPIDFNWKFSLLPTTLVWACSTMLLSTAKCPFG